MPSEIPPRMPPAWLVRVRIAPPAMTKGVVVLRAPHAGGPQSRRRTPHPSPRGWRTGRRQAGSPTPGTWGFPAPPALPGAMHSTTPPTESPRLPGPVDGSAHSLPGLLIQHREGGCPDCLQRPRQFSKGVEGPVLHLGYGADVGGDLNAPALQDLQADAPRRRTGGAVSRPEKWPPPATSWKPRYFTWAV